MFNRESFIDDILEADRISNETRLNEYRRMYAEHLPAAAANEVLVDKNVKYSMGPSLHIADMAKAIKVLVPKAKIVAYACDPNLRVISKLIERQRRRVLHGDKKEECIDCATMLFNDVSLLHHLFLYFVILSFLDRRWSISPSWKFAPLAAMNRPGPSTTKCCVTSNDSTCRCMWSMARDSSSGQTWKCVSS